MKRSVLCLTVSAAALGALWMINRPAPAPTHNPDELAAVRASLVPAEGSGVVCSGRKAKADNGNAVGSSFTALGHALISRANAAESAPEPINLGTLWDGLGPTDIKISAKHELAQAFFNQGMRLSYNFNHYEAIRSFKAAQTADPECAMCYWGEAFALGPNINAPMNPADNGAALNAVQKAVDNLGHATQWERDMIYALSQRYAPGGDRASLDLAFAKAMLEVADRYPDNHDIAALAVEAQMDTTPWDYWEADKQTPKGQMKQAWPRIKALLQQAPDHPAAIHLFIHITEASANPYLAEPYADKLGGIAPFAGHLVHMPTHTYYKIGRYIDAITANIRAVQVDEAYLAETGAQSLYAFAYYPHNVHFVMASSMMAGNRDIALSYANKLLSLVPPQVAESTPLVQPVLAAPFYALGEYENPISLLARPNPAPTVPYVTGAYHYARGLAYVRVNDLDGADRELKALQQIATQTDFSAAEAQGIPATNVMKVAAHVLQARMALLVEDLADAEAHYRAAVRLQDTLNYTEPPYWYYPVRRSLGRVLLMQGKPDQAMQAFRRSLADQPNDGLALFGLASAAEKSGDKAAAEAARDLIPKAWDGPDIELEQL